MKRHIMQLCSALGAIVVMLVFIAIPMRAATYEPKASTVRTIAGSGRGGIADGPAAMAEFLSPVSVAYDSHANLYIADRAAQRIKMLSPNGVVRTVAGSGPVLPIGLGVQGGYLDGPAQTARFNVPLSIAVGGDDAVYVADSANRVVRRIKDGMVTTFAGVPNSAGSEDGPKAAMRMRDPRSLAFDSKGNLYVADFPNGIRRIDSAGIASTLKLNFPDESSVSSIAIVKDGHDYLFASVVDRVVEYDLDDKAIVDTHNASRSYTEFPLNEAGNAVGPIASLAAFNVDEWVAVDPLDGTVEFHQSKYDYMRVMNAEPRRNAASSDGGFRDGSVSEALFDEPLGVAIAKDGAIIVADTGNKRIRRIFPIEHSSGALACCTIKPRYKLQPESPDAGEYRVALLGNSYVWTNSNFSDSIAGRIERSISADESFKKTHLNIRVFPIRQNGAGGYQLVDYARNLLTTGAFDFVFVAYSRYTGTHDGRSGGVYEPSFTRALTALNAEMEKAGTGLAVVPFLQSESFPNGSAYSAIPKRADQPGIGDSLLPYVPAVEEQYKNMLAVAAAAHVPYIDMGSVFVKEELSASRVRLFDTWDAHLTPRGMAVFAQSLAEFLKANRPWIARKSRA